MIDIKAKWQAFREWQRKPFEPAPIQSDDQHHCLNCGESYDGKYCPRCGQHYDTRRFTFRNALMYLVEVWGMSNSVFQRTIGHLLTRPGYMIADYLKGHRQPYFQPVRLLFISVTIFLIVDFVLPQGNEIDDDNFLESVLQGTKRKLEVEHQLEAVGNAGQTDDGADMVNKDVDEEMDDVHHIVEFSMRHFSIVLNWFDRNKALSLVIYHTVIAFIITWLFRNAPRLPRATFVENFFAQIFISTQLIVVAFIVMLITFPFSSHEVGELEGKVALLIQIVDYKQLYGYGWWGTIWRAVLSILIYVAILIVAIMLVFLVIAIYLDSKGVLKS